MLVTPALASADPPAGTATDSVPSSDAAAAWQTPHESVSADPADIADDVGRYERARVVVLSRQGDSLDVTTVATKGAGDAVAAITQAQADPESLAVGVDHRVQAQDSDPLRPRQWGLDLLSTEAAWAIGTGRGAVVAVIDSGVDGSHPDLAAAMVPGKNTRTDRGDYSSPDTDTNGHGTHVAGIIAARANNGKGIAGVAPDAQIMPVKVLDSDGSGWMADVIEGIIWAAQNGADVINMSLGGPDADFSAAAIEFAQSRGVVVVAAAGNEGSNTPMYPAALPGVVSVSALDDDGSLASYSNYGDTVDIAAPGSQIVSTVPGGYSGMTGTSMAAPHVAGVAALIRGYSPSADVQAVLVTTAVSAALGRQAGVGVVAADAALRSLCPSCGETPADSAPTPEPNPESPAIEAPAKAIAPAAQSIKVPTRVKTDRSKALSRRTEQGTAATWRARTPSKCTVVRTAGAVRVRGKNPGICRLRVTAPATANLVALKATTTIRVTGR
jgi:subtilisin family serine protease